MAVNNFLCKYSIKQFSPPCLYLQFSGNSRSELANNDGKACNNIPEAVMLYHILVDDKAKILPCNKTLSFV
jgi:hypothetical protein